MNSIKIAYNITSYLSELFKEKCFQLKGSLFAIIIFTFLCIY